MNRNECSYRSATCGGCKTGYVEYNDKCVEQCGQAIDLAFLLDASGSISKAEFNLQLKFIEQVADRFHVGTGQLDAQVALGTFHNKSSLWGSFGQFTTNGALNSKINSITHPQGNTDTRAGIKMMETHIFETERKMRPASANVARILLVITNDNQLPHRVSGPLFLLQPRQ